MVITEHESWKNQLYKNNYFCKEWTSNTEWLKIGSSQLKLPRKQNK